MTRLPLLFALALAAFACSEPASTPEEAPGAGEVADAGDEAPLDELPSADAGACAVGEAGPASGFSRAYAPLASGSIVQDKAFYLLTVLDGDPAARGALAADGALGALASSRDARLRGAPAACGEDAACLADAVAIAAEDVAPLGDALASALAAASALAPLASSHLRPSGTFALHEGLADDALVRAAWADAAAALEEGIDAYARSLDGAKLAGVVADAIAAHPAPMPFYAPALAVVLGAMQAEGRDEAARYEPLAAGENAKALARVATTDWSAWPYTAILVPGLGPTSLEVALSEGGRKRCDLAVERFQAKLAPFIVTSGGHVHPDRTPYAEAIEMKKYLVSQRGIPEEAILVDPHARHTTTNLRDGSRLLFRYGVPTDRPVLVTSDLGQSLYMVDPGLFWSRCDDELGYRPWRALARLTDHDACMIPSVTSLFADGRDALDP